MVGHIVSNSVSVLIKDFSDKEQQSYLFERVNRTLFIVKYYSPKEGYCKFCGSFGCGCKKVSYKKIDNASLTRMIRDIKNEDTVEIFYKLNGSKRYDRVV